MAARLRRRRLLRGLSVLPLAAAACSRREPDIAEPESASLRPKGGSTLPVIFAAHGAPVLLDDAEWMGQLASWAKALSKPQAVLMVSAHWEARPVTLGATEAPPLVYDFSGFPERFYRMKYPVAGAPKLAARVGDLLKMKRIDVARDATRGLDHGAYVPLMAMYPRADVPVLQLSMPALEPRALFALGEALAPLRSEGVLICGSGFLTHNMGFAGRRGVPGWASEFDDWAAEALSRFDVDALLDFQARAPAASLALPTWEHYAPLLVSVGAAAQQRPQVSFPIAGWWMDGPFTKRSVQLS